jgi:hypothetical protein
VRARGEGNGKQAWSLFVVAGLAVALFLAFLVSPQASSQPDGLEKVAIDKGFVDEASEHDLAGSPLADYGVEGVEDEGLSTGLAGVIGVAVCFTFCLALFGLARRGRGRGRRTTSTTTSPLH